MSALRQQFLGLPGPGGHRLGYSEPEQDRHLRISRIRHRVQQLQELPVLPGLNSCLIPDRPQEPGGIARARQAGSGLRLLLGAGGERAGSGLNLGEILPPG